MTATVQPKKKPAFEPIDIGLDICPFCGQRAEFGLNRQAGHFELRHHPTGLCIARTQTFCGKEYEQQAAEVFALKLWPRSG